MDFKGLLPTSSTLYFFIYYHFSNNQSFRIVASLTTWRRQWYPSRLFPTLRMTKKANQWWPWARIPPPPFPSVWGTKLFIFRWQQQSAEVMTGNRVFSQHLCCGNPLFTSPAQSKQDESQEPLTKSWELLLRHNPLNVVHICKMSSYMSRNQAGLLLNKPSDFLFSLKGHRWRQTFLLSCGSLCTCVLMHSHPVIFRGRWFCVGCPCLLLPIRSMFQRNMVVFAGDYTPCSPSLSDRTHV